MSATLEELFRMHWAYIEESFYIQLIGLFRVFVCSSCNLLRLHRQI